MNIHDPIDVIDTMIRITNSANDIAIAVLDETIYVSAIPASLNDFKMRWSYPGYGNKRVREIAQEYVDVLEIEKNAENTL